MQSLYLILGMITFWAIAGFAAFLLVAKAIWPLLLTFGPRTWPMQTLEYFRFKKQFAKWKAKGFVFDDPTVAYGYLKTHKGRVEGRMKPGYEVKWRERHLFRKRLLIMLNEVLQSPAAQRFEKGI